jgi:hypothetical protein
MAAAAAAQKDGDRLDQLVAVSPCNRQLGTNKHMCGRLTASKIHKHNVATLLQL